MLGKGLTKGVFQLEKSLGKRWSEKVKPRNIRDIADVVSLIRPGCLEATFRIDEQSGKKYSISDTYVAVKDRILQAEYIDSSLEPILKDTYSVPIYQEQLMSIAVQFAGFDLKQADDLRKGVGKKNKALVDSIREKFVASAINNGKDKLIAEEVFSWIQKFSGYGFNLSHAISYAINGYQTAYAKRHFPAAFFRATLNHANGDANTDWADEVKELVCEAGLFGVEVTPPVLSRLNNDFSCTGKNRLAFGLAHIKGIGESSLSSLAKVAEAKTESEFYKQVFKGKACKKDVAEALIKSGALDYIDVRRNRVVARYRILGEMTDRERNYLIDNNLLDESIAVWLTRLEESKVPRPLDKRLEKLRIFMDNLRKVLGGDQAKNNIAWEKYYLGMSLSGHEVDIYSSEKANTSCRDFLRLKNNTSIAIAVFLDDVKVFKDKKGQNMAFLRASDNTYLLDGVVVFSSVYEKVSMFLEAGNIVLLSGKKRDGSFLVNDVEVI
jgi:DNA polymerase-3 subunit alpha